MTVSDNRLYPEKLHIIHGILLAGTVPLFLGALLSDIAYASTYHIQWTNFASWFVAGALVFAGFALLWALINLVRAKRRGGPIVWYTMLLFITWVVGFYNSLIHAKDAWASMPLGLILSAIVVLLACVSTWVGFAKFGVGGAK